MWHLLTQRSKLQQALHETLKNRGAEKEDEDGKDDEDFKESVMEEEEEEEEGESQSLAGFHQDPEVRAVVADPQAATSN